MNHVPEAIDPGVVVLSTSLKLLHINHKALSLLQHLQRSAPQPEANLNLTAPLHAHGQDIITAMHKRLTSSDFTPFHCYRVIGECEHEILLKGFGLPDRRGFPHSRIVMLLVPQSRQRSREPIGNNPPLQTALLTT